MYKPYPFSLHYQEITFQASARCFCLFLFLLIAQNETRSKRGCQIDFVDWSATPSTNTDGYDYAIIDFSQRERKKGEVKFSKIDSHQAWLEWTVVRTERNRITCIPSLEFSWLILVWKERFTYYWVGIETYENIDNKSKRKTHSSCLPTCFCSINPCNAWETSSKTSSGCRWASIVISLPCLP